MWKSSLYCHNWANFHLKILWISFNQRLHIMDPISSDLKDFACTCYINCPWIIYQEHAPYSGLFQASAMPLHQGTISCWNITYSMRRKRQGNTNNPVMRTPDYLVSHTLFFEPDKMLTMTFYQYVLYKIWISYFRKKYINLYLNTKFVYLFILAYKV